MIILFSKNFLEETKKRSTSWTRIFLDSPKKRIKISEYNYFNNFIFYAEVKTDADTTATLDNSFVS